ncbi:TPA: CPBP family glutamic-type intramembrane protease [Streptococcus pneumoniae]
MKKIISHRYFIIVFLLVIADQKFSVLVLRSDLVTGLSDFAYYLSDMMLNFLVVLFGVSHISNHGWVLTDFVFYMGGGLIFAVLFRMTKSIYWPIGLHIVYNGIGQLLMLL